jgi:putative salt-induced outer membrane protein YdiY
VVERAMRSIAFSKSALITASLLALAARGQSTSPYGPALIPPPTTAISTPWPAPADGGDSQVPTPSLATAESQTSDITPIPIEEQLPLPTGVEPSLKDDSTAESELPDLDEPPVWYKPTYWLGPAPWDTGIELGLNGSSGTSDTLSIRTGGYVKRESRFSKLDLSTYYNRTTDGGAATQNNAQADVRNDWLLDEQSPWTLYGTLNLFYDEFQAFDLQTSGNTGVGYRFVHEPGLEMLARVGAGTSREIGGPDDRWVPESLVGFEYSQQLSATQKFYGKLDYYPEWEEIGEYRMVADTGWEIELVQPSNLSLKISATDRYDSTPNGADPHLLNYSVLLLLKL